MEIILAKPRGFCAGVVRAITIVNESIKRFGAPTYVRHEIVHNKQVVEELKEKSVIFVNELKEIPDGSRVIFSAHGVSTRVVSDANARGLRILDATCPLVTKVHVEVRKLLKEGYEIIMIGHRGHPEVEGTLGQSQDDKILLIENIGDAEKIVVSNPNKLAYVTQTTLSIDDTQEIIDSLQSRFPKIIGPKVADICYATQNRQNAVKELAGYCDLIIVIGSQTSSNSKQLRETALKLGVEAYLIDGADGFNPDWIKGKTRIGLTAGASAPEVLITEMISLLFKLGATRLTELKGDEETTTFPMPKELQY